jgi:2,5-diamino-6-(ribosylamino)-4(3H)-pyrimidinone 5'-phosphate reductase
MLSSIDGKIDGAALAAITPKGLYEETGASLHGDAWICGRTTMQQHFAEKEPFASASNEPGGPCPPFVARRATSYAVSVDTLGKLRWRSDDIDGDHLICVVSEQVPEDYLTTLRETGISYIVAGKESVDIETAVNALGEHFGIRTLLLEGGGHINGAFLAAHLIDEVSLVLVPGIDGRHDIPAVFDGISPSRNTAVPLKLRSVEQRDGGSLWIRYEVIQSS